jgi:zinc metalloprotease ZmpB
MSQQFDAAGRLYIDEDVPGHGRVVRPADGNRPTAAQLPQLAAGEFLTEHADVIGVRPEWLTGAALAGAVEGVDDVVGTQAAGDIELRFSEEKPQFDSTTVGFQQTWRGIPVWRAGVAVTMRTEPARVANVHVTAFPEIDVDLPSQTKLRRAPTGERGLMSEGLGTRLAQVSRGAGLTSDGEADRRRVEIVTDRLVVYRYDAARRLSDEVTDPDRKGDRDRHEVAFPFDVPPAPDLEDGSFRIAREIVFRIVTPPRGVVTWLALLDVDTGALLYLRPFVADVTGLVFAHDPLTAGGTAGPASTAATLNPFRTSVTLVGLQAPAAGAEQSLTGDRVQVSDFEPATVAPPTRPAGSSFDFGSRTNDFAAVNAYHHNDGFFRLVESMGFTTGAFFDGTTFPVPVDHRGRFGSTDGIEINASCSGTGTGGIANVDYELADLGDTANPIGLANDLRVVLHELGGHGILYDHVNSANFGFAHSAGDSFAAVLCDPDSQAADRFLTFPWVAGVISRRHDRPVGGGWAWGGTQDVGGYSSEQILATSHFRIYRSLGGDSGSVHQRRFAARVTAYLMLRGVSTLTQATNPSNVTGWVNALLAADAGAWTSEGLAGGAYGKVIRWAFEKQGLYQAPGAPTPVAREGRPPAQDVYIDDGRNGEYQHQPVHWNNQSVWNRRFADDGTAHEDPWLNRTNFAYTRVRNRGTATATGVVVRAFHTDPGAGLVWPDDWQAMTTAQIAVPDIPAGGQVVVGPFAWTPTTPDHECLLMVASSSGDPSNVDALAPGESIAEWRLVPHDNNIGQRNVHPVPAAGGAAGVMAVLDGRTFTVRNPFDTRARVVLDIDLPAVLREKGWQVAVSTRGGTAFSLAAGGSKRVRLSVVAGGELTAAEVAASPQRDVVVSVTGNGILLGGMTYRLDPDQAEPMPQDDAGEHGDHGRGCRCGGDRCTAAAKGLLRCLDLPGNVSGVRVRRVGVDIELDGDC